MSEQRQKFIRDYRLNGYSVSELSERLSILKRTAHKWINRYEEFGASGFAELSGGATSQPGPNPGRGP